VQTDEESADIAFVKQIRDLHIKVDFFLGLIFKGNFLLERGVCRVNQAGAPVVNFFRTYESEDV
jgi:hypothetical protein